MALEWSAMENDAALCPLPAPKAGEGKMGELMGGMSLDG